MMSRKYWRIMCLDNIFPTELISTDDLQQEIAKRFIQNAIH